MSKSFRLHAPVYREHPIHKSIADVFRLELAAPGKVSRHGAVWWSCDLAGYSGNAPGIRTSHGVISGIPDMLVIYRGKAHFLEIKAEDGVVSLPQQSVATAVLIAGAEWGTARDAIEALQLLDQWFIPRSNRVKL